MIFLIRSINRIILYDITKYSFAPFSNIIYNFFLADVIN